MARNYSNGCIHQNYATTNTLAYKWRKWTREQLHNLPNVMQLVSDRVKI